MFRKSRSVLFKALLALIAVIVTAASSYYLYSQVSHSPVAVKANQQIDAARDLAIDERGQWRERVADLRERVRKTIESDDDSLGIRRRLETISDEFDHAREDLSPVYREQLEAWKGAVDDAVSSPGETDPAEVLQQIQEDMAREESGDAAR